MSTLWKIAYVVVGLHRLRVIAFAATPAPRHFLDVLMLYYRKQQLK
jgi:hypothetical protein